MRLHHLLAATALTAGLVASAPAAAQAAPGWGTHPYHAQVAAESAKVKSTLTATVQETVKAGHRIQVKATLKHQTASGVKPSGHQKLDLLYFTGEGPYVVATAKTDLSGKVSFFLDTDRSMAGHSFRFRVVYNGTAKAGAAKSNDVKVKVTK